MAWQVEINREKLLVALKQNRANHKKTVAEALVGYRAKVIEVLDDRIATIKAGGPIDTYVHLPVPEDHTNEYDTIIGMLEASEQELVSLGAVEYRSYVEDKWDWKDRFLAGTAQYLSQNN